MNTDLFSAQPESTPKILTVGELNRAVASLLERSFPLVWVSGEISNLTRAASGHWYFSLKDRDAQVRCVMFRGRNQLVDWAPREGDRVEARALAGLYAARGDFQLNVEHLRRAGAGTLYEAFLRLKEKLQAEGLFDSERKRPLPEFPHVIGIVTSLQAAALRDVLTTLARRAPHVRVILYPAPVQGREAPPRIVEALRIAARRLPVDQLDVLLVVRGGGSIEDLWAFNDEAVARAIAAFPVPVVSGVGHETDFTIADFAADVRAPTPTAAAELTSPDALQLRRDVTQGAMALRRALRRRLEQSGQRLDDSARRLKSPLQRWRESSERLQGLAARLVRAQRAGQALAASRLERGINALWRARPDAAAAAALLALARERLARGVVRLQGAQAARVDLLAARLALLDPASALQRGYAMATDGSGRIVRDAAQLSIGASLNLRFAKGAAEARVERIRPPDGIQDEPPKT